MPFSQIDYSKTCIYKLVCRDLEIRECYVGSTTDMNKRKHGHKKACFTDPSRCVYAFINEHGGWENWDMVLIEAYPCSNSLESHQRERFHIERLNASLHKQVPTREKSEWYGSTGKRN